MTTALIVEDDPDQANMVSDLMALRGYLPIVAESGRDGLMRARRFPPGVILLDVMLPDTNGFDICRRLRSDPVTRSPPIVMVPAMDDPSNRRRGYRVGANAYVTKPYPPQDLYDAVNLALKWKADL